MKELELLIQKHFQLVKIVYFRPEKIEFKDERVKFKMCVLVIWTPVSIGIVGTTFAKHSALLNVIFNIKMTPVHKV